MILSLTLMLVATCLAMFIALARPRLLALFLLPAGLLHFGADIEGAGGLADLSSVWLLMLIAISLLAMVRLGTPRLRLCATEICFILFLLWCAIEAFRASEFTYASRSFLRLLFPFLSMYLARRAVDNVEIASRLLMFQLRATLVGGIVWLGALFVPMIFAPLTSLTWGDAAYLDHAAVILALALAAWKYRRDRRYALLAVFLVAACVFAVNRTAILAVAAALSLFFALEYRKLAVIVLPAVYVGACAVLLLVPAFRDKMFYQPDKADSGALLTASDVAGSNFNSDGRFAMWQQVLDRFFWPNPVIGSGLGTTQAWFYDGGAKEALHTDIKVEHSEYVKLASDTGLVGLGLFLLAFITAMGESAMAYRNAVDPTARIFALAAVCAIPVFLACIAFDNALLYVLPVAQIPLSLAVIASRLASFNAATAPATQKSFPPRNETLRLPRRPVGRRFASTRA